MRVWFYRSQYRGKGAGVLVRSAVWLFGEPKLKLRGVLILSLDRNIGLPSRFGRCNFGHRTPGTHLVRKVGVYKGMDMFPRFFFCYVKVDRALMVDRFSVEGILPVGSIEFMKRRGFCAILRLWYCGIWRSVVWQIDTNVSDEPPTLKIKVPKPARLLSLESKSACLRRYLSSGGTCFLHLHP